MLLCRLLRSLDYFCLTKSIIFSVIIIRAFSSNWAWYQTAQAVLYLVVSVVQLLTMHLRGDLYHRYRFKVGVKESGTFFTPYYRMLPVWRVAECTI